MDQSDTRNDNTLQDLGFGPEEDEEMSGRRCFQCFSCYNFYFSSR